jgi:hypothetical protein
MAEAQGRSCREEMQVREEGKERRGRHGGGASAELP